MTTGAAGCGGHGAGANVAEVSVPHKFRSPRKKDKAFRYHGFSCQFLARYTPIHLHIIHPRIYITLLRIDVR